MAVRRTLLLVLALALGGAALLAQETATPPSLRSGIDQAGFDRSVRPQDDFFQFVNGGWLAHTTIPADRRSYGTIDILRETVRERLHSLLEQTSSNSAAASPAVKQVADFYASFMDEAAAERRGVTPLREQLRAINGIQSRDDLARVLGQLSTIGVRTPFAVGVVPEPKHPEIYALLIRQGGLALPNRDYYVKEGVEFDRYREQYAAYAAKLLSLAGEQADGARVLRLETELAKVYWPAADARDQLKIYNPIDTTSLTTRYPGHPWRRWLAALGAENPGSVVVAESTAIAAVARGVGEWPLDDWRAYLKVALLDTYAPYLGTPFVEAEFAYRGRGLNGQPQMPERWKRAVTTVDAYLGESLGRMYVDRYFSADARARMERLVENLRSAFGEAIDQVEWMSPDTKREARTKLAAFRPNVGYPSTWRDYSAVRVGRDTLAANVMSAERAESARQINRIGRPVDVAEWAMTPPTVNAQYNSRKNAIFFPAGILQAPLFDPAADDAANYGAIGAIIGHEMGHGFDDQGRRSDAQGRLRDWWTAADATGYDARATRIAAQFGDYDALPGLKVDGRLTLGENIGDLTGVTIALRAYRISLNGQPAPVIDGYTGEQRFFMSWAQVWRTVRREDALRAQVLSDPHSPDRFRTNGALANVDSFFTAFDIKPGDRMWVPPDQRTKIW